MSKSAKISPFLLAWMAGVIEMKGRIRRVDNPLRRTAQLILQVRSRHIEQMQRLGDMTGTKVSVQDGRFLEAVSRKSCIEHCPDAHVHTNPEMPRTACWAVTGAGAAVVLHNLLPYLCATDGLQSWIDDVVGMLPKHGRGYAAVAGSVNRLAELGWVVPDGLIPDVAVTAEAAEAA